MELQPAAALIFTWNTARQDDHGPERGAQARDHVPRGGEIVSVLQLAMMGDLPYTALRDAVLAHPTLAESINNLFMALDD